MARLHVRKPAVIADDGFLCLNGQVRCDDKSIPWLGCWVAVWGYHRKGVAVVPGLAAAAVRCCCPGATHNAKYARLRLP